jgi:hypothetical protein
MLAGRLTANREARALLPPIAVSLVLASSVLATYVASGMTDVPVAAMVAATGAAIWTPRSGRFGVALVVLCATAAVLAKPTALLGLAGLLAAAFILNGRRAVLGAVGIAAGIAVALAYDLWQAARLDLRFADFVTAGNEEFWRERGEAARWDALARAEWYGAGLRLVIVFGLVHALARTLGARSSIALGAAAGAAILWSVGGPLLADGDVGYPFNGSVAGIAVWLVLAAAMLAAPFLSEGDPLGRRTYAALLVWLAPVAGAWAWQRADEVRHLAPAWGAIVLVTTTGLLAVSLALARLRPAAAAVPAAAIAALVITNLPSIDGLGRDGWRGLLDLGPSGWSSREARENYAYGPFSYELNLARENAGEDGRIVSSNGRLSYFFPGRFEMRYARTCAELRGARFFSFLRSGESLEFAQRQGQPIEPLGWLQCTEPRLELVGEQQGIYAAFVVGGPPARAPTPDDCRISGAPGQMLDAVFGEGLTYAEAKALRRRALGAGFEGTRIERTGCSRFRVLVTGVPAEEAVQAELRREVESVGLTVHYLPAVRYPETPPDVDPVP